MQRILCINPGSTSTKIAIFDDNKEIASRSIDHTPEELKRNGLPIQQFEWRRGLVYSFLDECGVDRSTLTCIMFRCGMLPPVPAGAWRLNQDMLDCAVSPHTIDHPNNLACRIANELVQELHIPAFTIDAGTVDELLPELHYTGIPYIRRTSLGHELNPRYIARKTAREILHKPYNECTIIVAHLGGGASVSLHHNGKCIQKLADETCMSPERAGRIPPKALIKTCYSGRFTEREMQREIQGHAGLNAYYGNPDARALEKRIADGDEEALLIYKAMAASISGSIAEEAALVQGKVDRIVLTAGMAFSKMYTDLIRANCEWIAPVELMPGEFEMQALADGGVRIMNGEEPVQEFHWKEPAD